MAQLPADRTKLAAAQSNMTPSVTASSQKLKEAVTEAYDTIDTLYNFTTGLISAGTLSRLGIVNVVDYGAKGDDVIDDTAAIQNALNALQSRNGGTLLLEPNKTYRLTSLLNIDLTAKGALSIKGNGATFHFTSNIRYIDTGIVSIGGTGDGISVEIDNLNFNADGVVPDWSSTKPNGGRGAFFIKARKIAVRNCNFSDLFFSAAVWTHYGEQVLIENCNGVRVGGRSFDNTEDARGDALYFGYLGINDNVTFRPSRVKVSNCSFKGHDVVNDVTNENSSHAGRCGVTIEFSKNNTTKEVLIENSHFYNYQRAIHLENMYGVKLTVLNCKLEEFALGVYVHDSDSLRSLHFQDCEIVRSANVRNWGTWKGAFIEANISGGSTKTTTVITVENCYFNIVQGNQYLCSELTDAVVFKVLFDNCRFESIADIRTTRSFSLFRNCVFVASNVKIEKGLSNFETCTFLKRSPGDAGVVSIDPSEITTGPNSMKPLYTRDCVFNNYRYSCVLPAQKDLKISHYNDTFFADDDFVGVSSNYFFISHYLIKTGEIAGCRFVNVSTSKVLWATENSATVKQGATFRNNTLQDVIINLSDQKGGILEGNYLLFTKNVDKPILLLQSKQIVSNNIISHAASVAVTNLIFSDVPQIAKVNNYDNDTTNGTFVAIP